MRLRNALWLIALAPLLLIGAATPASAHSSQLDASPPVNAVLDGPPAQVRIVFDTPLLETGSALVVTGPDGTVISDPSPAVDAETITAALDPTAPPGTYTVAYRVVSSDGHTVTSSYEYTVAGAASASAAPSASTADESASPVTSEIPSAAPTTAPPQSPSGGLPLWIWVIAAVGLLAIVLAVFARRRR